MIFETISSGHKIDIKKFADYTEATAKLYVQLYRWYPMSPTVHKVLVHGATVISYAILPIGQLSEEARNKHFRQYRQDFSRKFSRELCMRDVLNRLLLSSDPFLSCSKPKSRRRRKSFSSDTLQLLLPETPNVPLLAGEAEEGSDEGEDEVDETDGEASD